MSSTSAARSCADRLRAVTAVQTAAVERLPYADTSLCMRVKGSGEAVTLRLDRDRVEVTHDAGQAEIDLELDAHQLERFAAGTMLLQRELLEGRIQHRGPVWKFLRVTPIITALLRSAGGNGAASANGGPAAASSRPRPTSGCDMWAIECRDVHKSFRSTKVLEGIDLRIPEGLITIILGPSGTGKSVLLKHTIGLLEPDRGELLVRGKPLGGYSTAELMRLRRSFGVLFQDGALWASMNVADNVAFPLRQHTDLSQPEIEEIVASRLMEVGLSTASALMPSELSGGMRKRAGLARAVALEPEIMLFDEPDSGLDPVRTALLCDLIADIHAQHGGTFVVVTHDIGVLRQIGQYVAVLWQGKIAAEGFSDDVLASRDPFVQQFLAGDVDGPLGMG